MMTYSIFLLLLQLKRSPDDDDDRVNCVVVVVVVVVVVDVAVAVPNFQITASIGWIFVVGSFTFCCRCLAKFDGRGRCDVLLYDTIATLLMMMLMACASAEARMSTLWGWIWG